jgi:undecaprenyl-diphosphatase
MSKGNIYHGRLLILLISITAFRLLYINLIDLAPDEAYYWDISRILQFSYYDHPPMEMYLISFFTKAFGSTEFAVRLPSVVIGALVTVIVYLLGKEMFDERVGFYSALLTNMTLIYSVGGVTATIDTPFALFWLLALYFGVKALKTGEGKWWYMKDISLGLGLLSKYIMALFVPAFIIFLLLSREHRHWLRRKEPYIGSVIALLIFSPVILWNAQNDWVSFKFQLAHGLKIKKKTGIPSLLEYIGSQAAVLSPFLFIACVWAMVKGLTLWIRGKDWRYLFLMVTSAFVILFFGYSSLRAKVEGNWPMTAYFTAIIAFVSINVHCRGQSPLSSLLVFGTALLFTVFAHIQAVHPIIPIKKDPTDQLHGWRELGEEAEKTLSDAVRAHAMRPDPFIMADSHQLTAEMAFYIPGQPRVYEVSGVGKFNQYNMREGPRPGSDGILIGGPGKEGDSYINSLFDEIREIGKVELRRGGKVIKTYSLYICRNFHGFPYL